MRDREPQYGGKPIGKWLDEAASQYSSHAQVFPETLEAINQIGTNAVPYLLKALKYQQPRWQTQLPKRLHIFYFSRVASQRYDRMFAAAYAFRALGPQAKGAIPELAAMMDSRNAVLCQVSSHALGAIGSDAIPVLLDFLSNAPAHPNINPADIATAWCALGTNATSALPTLLGCLENPDSRVADTSESILITYVVGGTRIEIIGPDLCKKLGSTNALTRAHAGRLLKWFGNQGGALRPYLQKALDDPDPRVRGAAIEVIHNIESRDQHADDQGTSDTPPLEFIDTSHSQIRPQPVVKKQLRVES